MGLVGFDTHQFIQTLSQSGMPVEQAEAISNAVRMAYAYGASDLVTNMDMKQGADRGQGGVDREN